MACIRCVFGRMLSVMNMVTHEGDRGNWTQICKVRVHCHYHWAAAPYCIALYYDSRVANCFLFGYAYKIQIMDMHSPQLASPKCAPNLSDSNGLLVPSKLNESAKWLTWLLKCPQITPFPSKFLILVRKISKTSYRRGIWCLGQGVTLQIFPMFYWDCHPPPKTLSTQHVLFVKLMHLTYFDIAQDETEQFFGKLMSCLMFLCV